MNKSHLIYRTAILSGVNFIVRILGFVYKIVLSKIIGAEGIGIFQMSIPVLMLFVTIPSSGIPIAVSKIIAKQPSTHSKSNQKIFNLSILITLIISVSLSILLIITSKSICTNILKNQNLYLHILFLSPAIVIISLSSVIRGFFYGMKLIKPTSISQILEQLSRIVFVLGYLYYLSPIKPHLGALIAIIGLSLGELIGLTSLISFYQAHKKNSLIHNFTTNINVSSTKILHKIINISTPITISKLISISLQLVNAVIIPNRLIASGLSSKEAISSFGRVTGMTMPFIFLPFIVISALAVNVIPNISRNLQYKNYSKIKNDTNTAIKIAILISFPLTAIYILFSHDIGLFLYNDELVGIYIKSMGYSTIFLALHHIIASILHGLGKQVYTTINHAIGMSIQLLITYISVSNPNIRIYGFFISFFIGNLITFILNAIILRKTIKLKNTYIFFALKVLASTIIMIIIGNSIYIRLCNIFISSHLLILALALICAFVTYLVCIILFEPKLFKH